MNDELELTTEQLRQVTSRAPALDATMDSQMAATRDSFLSLGSALEAAAEGFDQAGLIAKLQDSGMVAKSCPLAAEAADGGRQRWWMLCLAGALAGAVLIAIGQMEVQQRQLPQNGERSGAVEVEVASAWHDALDEQIASAQAEVQQLSAESRGLDSSLLEMNGRLEAMSRELLGESL